MNGLIHFFSDRQRKPVIAAGALAVLLVYVAGAVTILLHRSNDPVILGRYAADFFAILVAYHLMLVIWAALTFWLMRSALRGDQTSYQRLTAWIVARPWLMVLLLAAMWGALAVFYWYIEFKSGTLHWLVRAALTFTVGLITLALLDARDYRVGKFYPYQYGSLAASLLTVVTLLAAYVLYTNRLDVYKLMIREDGLAEWLTVVAFLGTAILSFMMAARLRRAGRSYWFLLGLGLLCLFIAGEEISWGQRLLGFSTPEGYDQYNYQNETTLHNILPQMFGISSRQIYTFVVIGYGMVIPLLAQFVKPVRDWLHRHSIVYPPLAMLPLFLVVAPLGYLDKPTGREEEIAEMLFGFGFWLTAIVRHSRLVQTGHLFAGEGDDG